MCRPQEGGLLHVFPPVSKEKHLKLRASCAAEGRQTVIRLNATFVFKEMYFLAFF